MKFARKRVGAVSKIQEGGRSEFMFSLIKKRIIGLSIFLVISLSTCGCVNPEDINWENTPITGIVLGTVEYPELEDPPRNKISIKLDSGEIVLLNPPRKMFIVKGQKVKLLRGTTDSGRKFYDFARSS